MTFDFSFQCYHQSELVYFSAVFHTKQLLYLFGGVERNQAPRKGDPGWSARLHQLNDSASASAAEQAIKFHASIIFKSLDVVERQNGVGKGSLELDKPRFAHLLSGGLRQVR